jgi:uncharacterized membrane protein
MLLALLIGIVAGLRAMTAPAAVSWAGNLGRLDLSGSWLVFLDKGWAAIVFTVAALVELVTDQLPSTPSRTVPVQLAARLISGGVCGAAIGAPQGIVPLGFLAGVAGAALGTYGGSALRSRLAQAFGSDRPAALVEDAIAIAGACAVVAAL